MFTNFHCPYVNFCTKRMWYTNVGITPIYAYIIYGDNGYMIFSLETDLDLLE